MMMEMTEMTYRNELSEGGTRDSLAAEAAALAVGSASRCGEEVSP
jgi:hypothetical protein